MEYSGYIELIDTQWNVNIENYDRYEEFKDGINRYIVECKFTKLEEFNIGIVRINRYIVECKYLLDCWQSVGGI